MAIGRGAADAPPPTWRLRGRGVRSYLLVLILGLLVPSWLIALLVA
jgi:hypothetical protein